MYHITITDLDTQEIEVDMDTSLIMGVIDNEPEDAIKTISYLSGIDGKTYLCALEANLRLMMRSSANLYEKYAPESSGTPDCDNDTTEEGG